MSQIAIRFALCAFALSVGLGAAPARTSTNAARSDATAKAKAGAEISYSKLTLAFEPNQGQADPRVEFLSRGHGYSMFLTPAGATLVLMKRRPGSGVTVQAKGRIPAMAPAALKASSRRPSMRSRCR